MQKTVFVSKVVQPLTAPITIFTVEVNRAKEPRSSLPRGWCRAFLRHASSRSVCSISTSTFGENILNLSRFSTQVVPIVKEANCDETCKQPAGALFTETLIAVETHLVANVSLRRPANSRIAHRKTA